MTTIPVFSGEIDHLRMASSTSPCLLSAVEMLALYRAGTLSPVAVVDACLRRIDEVSLPPPHPPAGLHCYCLNHDMQLIQSRTGHSSTQRSTRSA